MRPRGNRYIRISVAEDGRETVREHRRLASLRASDGDVLIVRPGANIQIGGVTLEGEVRVPGRRSLGAARSVRQLIRDVKTLGKDAYLPFAVIRRLDEGTQSPIYLPVNLLRILTGRGDMALQSADSVIVFHREDVEFLRSADVQAILTRMLPPSVVLASPTGRRRLTPGGARDDATGRNGRRRSERALRFEEAAPGFIPQLPAAETLAESRAAMASRPRSVNGNGGTRARRPQAGAGAQGRGRDAGSDRIRLRRAPGAVFADRGRKRGALRQRAGRC